MRGSGGAVRCDPILGIDLPIQRVFPALGRRHAGMFLAIERCQKSIPQSDALIGFS
jgi:hypothetical protein